MRDFIFSLSVLLLLGCGHDKSVGVSENLAFTAVSDRFEVCGQYQMHELFTMDPTLDRFSKHTYTGRSGRTLPYRLYLPKDYDPNKQYPIVLYLHGGFGTGTDNARHLETETNFIISHVFTSILIQDAYPHIFLAPQSSSAWGTVHETDLHPNLQVAVEILKLVSDQYSVDAERIYAVGTSSGGAGAWDLITKTNLFAAAVPMVHMAPNTLTTSVTSSFTTERIEKSAKILAHRSFWFFFGENDYGGNLKSWWVEMYAAILKEGGSPRYTEYISAGHEIVTCVVTEDGLYQWLFSQRK